MFKIVLRSAAIVIGLVGLTGCAAADKSRVDMLEGANRNFAERARIAEAERDACRRDQDTFNRRLQASLEEVRGLKEQLAQASSQPPAPPGWTAVPGGGMIAIEDDLLFAPGKTALRTEARKLLDGIASTIQREYADKDVFVWGHTDDQPIQKSGWLDNYELSAERALAVVRYLRDKSVTAERLIACGSGEFRPRAPNNSADNRQKNRRVEVYAIAPIGRASHRP